MDQNGIINLLKPPEMTSHDAVNMLRKIIGMKKIGHTGTLDPMATGVLPICAGKATRIIEYLENDTKKYRCEMALGIETDTQDIWGTPLRRDISAAKKITAKDVDAVLSSFLGKQQQIPPKYSAIKVNGKKLYEYARQGVDVEIKSREINIFDIRQIRFDEKNYRSVFDVHCSKGTYVRTICSDIGERLGCGASMSFLSRTASGVFTLENSVTIEQLQENGFGNYMKDIDYPLTSLLVVNIPKTLKEKFGNGIKLQFEETFSDSQILDGQVVRVYCEKEFLGIARYDEANKFITAEKVLFK